WPMLYGALTMSALWLATRLLAVWPAGAEIPTVWPALFAVVMLAWTQALIWQPYPIPGLRVVVAVLLLGLIGIVVLLALSLETKEATMLALLAPQLPLAYLVARFGLARARRGDVPDWRGLFKRRGAVNLRGPVDSRDPVARRESVPAARSWHSGAQAQVWLEWQRFGRSLPALVAIVLPFELILLAISDATSWVLSTLVAVMLTPPILALFVAATVRSSNPKGRDVYELGSFVATKPLTSASLVAAKLKAAMLSALAAWLLVLVTVAIALQLSGTSRVVSEAWRQLMDGVGPARAGALGLLVLAALVIATWKHLVQGLFVGLSGRAWLVRASVFVPLLVLSIVLPLLPWILDHSREVIANLWNALLWIFLVLACCKLTAAAWVATRLYDRRLLDDRRLVLGVLTWTVIVLVLYALLMWLLPTMVFRTYFLALLAILAVPLVRIAAAPLALDWNRHR
ncbi:MAG: hypothetical protein AAF560_32025, partial [Acidobacteriota bacterium]